MSSARPIGEGFAEAIAGVGLNFSTLTARCSEVILFGSRAVGCPKAKDWDVMCITDQDLGLGEPFRNTAGGLNFKLGNFDFVVVSTEQTRDQNWLGWELAAHVARYGRWLHGAPGEWTSKTFVGFNSIRWRLQRINSRRRTLDFRRGRGHSLEEHRTDLRREIRRLRYLLANQAVPPRTILDEGPGPRPIRRET